MDLNQINKEAISHVRNNLKKTMKKIDFLCHCPGDIVQVGLCANTLFEYFPDVLSAHINTFANRFTRHAALKIKINIIHKIWFLYLTTFSSAHIERHMVLVLETMNYLKGLEDRNGILGDLGMLSNLAWIRVKLRMAEASTDRNDLMMKFRQAFYLESRGVFRTNLFSTDVDLSENLIYLIWNQKENVQYYRLKQDVIWQQKGIDYVKLKVALIYNDVFLVDENEKLSLYSSILFLLN